MRSQMIWWLATATLSIGQGGAAPDAGPTGYFLDDVSCKGKEYAAIEKLIDGMFKLAEAGVKNVEKATPNTAEQDLIDNLFGTSGQKFIKDTIKNQLGAIVELKTPKFTSNADLKPDLKTKNVKIYCNEDRLEVRKRNPLESYDKDIGQSTKTGNCALNVAYGVQSKKSHAQLQICPKLMGKILKDEYALSTDFKQSFYDKMVVSTLEFVGKFAYSEIDTVQLGDKILLHEMTHLDLFVDTGTNDVGGWSGYGWKNCRKLSAVTENRATEGAQGNADTWALYGPVSYLIANGKKTVEKDTGKVIEIATTATRRALDAVEGYWKNFVA